MCSILKHVSRSRLAVAAVWFLSLRWGRGRFPGLDPSTRHTWTSSSIVRTPLLKGNSDIFKPRPYFWHEIRSSTHREQFGESRRPSQFTEIKCHRLTTVWIYASYLSRCHFWCAKCFIFIVFHVVFNLSFLNSPKAPFCPRCISQFPAGSLSQHKVLYVCCTWSRRTCSCTCSHRTCMFHRFVIYKCCTSQWL